MAFEYPPRIRLAQLPTPLQPLDRLSARYPGTRIWVKRDDLTGSVAGGNKIRKLEFTLAAAVEAGCNTIITCGGLQSNHCRATAILCAQLGLKCHLLLRGEPAGDSDGNLLLDQLAGAAISCYPAKVYQQNLETMLAQWQTRYAESGDKAWVIPTGASDGIGCWGYVQACEELAADFQHHHIVPRHIVTATGSGGTQAGLTAGNTLFDLGCEIWGVNVCDDEAWFIDKVNSDIRDWRSRYQPPLARDPGPVRVIDGYVGPGYAQAGPEVFELIADLARTEGVVLDPVYTGKGFFGMLQELEAGRFGEGDIVFIHTGGVFGLFPQRQSFSFLTGR